MHGNTPGPMEMMCAFPTQGGSEFSLLPYEDRLLDSPVATRGHCFQVMSTGEKHKPRHGAAVLPYCLTYTFANFGYFVCL